MKVTVESINTLLSKVGLKLASKDGKVEMSSDKTDVKMMAEAKTSSGEMIATPAEGFDVGVEIFIVDADGNPTPAADGEYTLEDGTTITVVGGKLEAKTEVETETEMSTEDIAAVISSLSDQVNALTETVNGLTAERDTAAADLAKVKEEKTALAKQVAELSKKPAAQPTKKETANLRKEDEKPAKAFHEMNYVERIKAGLAKNK